MAIDCEYALELKNLKKVYERNGQAADLPALDDVNLTVPRGAIFALLGPNGAGKSTLINILAGLVRKTAGSAHIWGIDIDQNPRQARAAIGVVPQELNIDPYFTPRETLNLQAGLFGVPAAERRTEEILRMIELTDRAEAYTRTLSGGMRRRLLIGKALVHSPPVLILDEPTAGVDIELRQQLCDWIAIIDHGKLITSEPKHQLLARLEHKDMIITLAQALPASAALPAALAAFNPQRLNDHQLRITYRPQETPAQQILTACLSNGLELVDISTRETDLEDIFLSLTGAGSQA